MDQSTKSIVMGKCERVAVDEASTLITIQTHSDSFDAHWQQLNDGRYIVALRIGSLGVHLGLEDAEKIGYMVAALACEGIAARERNSTVKEAEAVA